YSTFAGPSMDAIRPSNTRKCKVLPLFRQFSAWLYNLAPVSRLRHKSTKSIARRFGGSSVLRIAAVVLLLLWVLGLVTGRTMGGFVHVLLVLALILGLIALVRGKNSPS